MSDLAELTRAFTAALTAPSVDDVPVTAFAGAPEAVRRRLGIYRGNVQANAEKALSGAFPIVARIVGAEFFGGLARAYATENPSTSGDLNEFGAMFAEYLAAFPPAAGLPYLPDVARLEWHVHCAHSAADAPAFDLTRLAAIPSERFPELRLLPAPATALVAAPWPIVRIFAVHQPDYDGEFDVDLDAGPDCALVYRPRFRVQVAALSKGAFEFLSACIEGRDLGAAVARAQAVEPTWRFDAALPGFVADRVLVDFALEDRM